MNYLRKNKSILAVFFGSSLLISCYRPTDVITIDLSQEKAEIPSSLYGIFFEEITHSGDGGLYAEMIQNRGFEDGTLPSGTVLNNGYAVAATLPCYANDSINNFKIAWSDSLFMKGWELICADGSYPQYSITTDRVLHKATPHSLRIESGKCSSEIRLMNTGYWGIAVEQGKKYNFQFHLNASDDSGDEVEAALIDSKGNRIDGLVFKLIKNGKWDKYEGSFTASATGNDFKFTLILPNKGTIYVDFVSMFPEDTFRGHKNGLRKDVAEMLEDLHPDFIRWPGGCIVEGLTMENRVKWEETIGDIVARPGEYNLWGYRSTYGFGYHEFLQFCEDIEAKGMFVCNAGMSCLFRNGDYYTTDVQVEELIKEALDAIEYAIGDSTTFWGKERARNGHPDPFPLHYVEIGNENVGSRYVANYNRFYKAIKEKYPQLELVCALMFSPFIKDAEKIDILDPHYYETAGWFYNNAKVYDKLPSNIPYKIYVGEYAAIGRSSLYSSLAEAAYLTGVERNADKVQLVSYAPLIENAAHGKDHLLILKNDSVYGRSNYHVLKMFSQNRPDVNLLTDFKPVLPARVYQPEGFVGIGTNNTSAEFRNFRITRDGEEVYSTQWNDYLNNWNPIRGEWKIKDGSLVQLEKEGDAIIWLKDQKLKNCVIEMKARKLSGREGFRILFGGRNNTNYFMADMGSHTNESVLFREVTDEGTVSLFDYRNTYAVKTDHWYDVRVEINGSHWKCYLDNELQYEYDYVQEPKRYVVSGYNKRVKEVIIKMVNAEETAWITNINLKNATKIGDKGKKIILSSPSKDDENSFADPEKVIPVISDLRINGDSFRFECEPNSFTILRIPCEKY